MDSAARAFFAQASWIQLLAHSPPGDCGSIQLLAHSLLRHRGSSCLRILCRDIVGPAARAFSSEASWVQLLTHSFCRGIVSLAAHEFSSPRHRGSSCSRIFLQGIVGLAACAFFLGHRRFSCLRIFPAETSWIQLLAHFPRRGIVDPAAHAFSLPRHRGSKML